jgi:sarcosine oxidase, subunit gamma
MAEPGTMIEPRTRVESATMPESRTARSLPRLTLSDTLQPLPPATRYILRGDAPVREAAASAFGVRIPSVACRASREGARAALWLGPDEWLLLAPDSESGAVAGGLAAALRDLPHSLVDVSHRQIGCSIVGPQAAELLSSGCPLDFDTRAFPVDMCTRTMLAKAEVVLWRTGAQTFHLEVWRSFAAYVSLFLAEAARGMTSVSEGARS